MESNSRGETSWMDSVVLKHIQILEAGGSIEIYSIHRSKLIFFIWIKMRLTLIAFMHPKIDSRFF